MRVFSALLLLVAAFAAAFALVDGKSASASHILVKTEKEALDLKQQIADGEDFAELAKAHSSCPSSSKGGALGNFSPGQMVKEFDTAVFDESVEVGTVQGPVKTQFGYHLILVTNRD